MPLYIDLDDDKFVRRRRCGRVLGISLLLFGLVIGLVVTAFVIVMIDGDSHPSNNVYFSPSQSVLGIYQNATVVADDGRCSDIGADLLRQGGSAVDAVIAAHLCNGIVNAHNLGLGGSSLIVVFDPTTNTSTTIDALEMAPHNSTPYMFVQHPELAVFGALAFAVPGQAMGFWEAHSRWGKLPWARLFEPAIDLCTNGFTVLEALERGIQTFEHLDPKLSQPIFNPLRRHLTNNLTGDFYKKGETMKCLQLAQTFRTLAAKGAHDLYNGTLAQLLDQDFSAYDVPINLADLSGYSVRVQEAVQVPLPGKNLRIFTARPPSAGVTTAFIAAVLDGFNWTAQDGYDPLSYHRFIEAEKFSYAQFSYFGDVGDELNPRLQNLTSPSFASHIRSLILDQTQPDSYYGSYGVDNSRSQQQETTVRSTSNVVAIDASGLAVSMTSTVGAYFGSCVMSGSTGLIFNNHMSNFNIPGPKSSPANYPAPGKRAITTMSPLVVVDNTNKARLVIGASGGIRIISAVGYAASRVLFFDENVKQAVDALRFLSDSQVLEYEKGMPEGLLQYLRDRGQKNMVEYDVLTVVTSAQRLNNGTILANADYRKFLDGYPAGL